MDRFEGDGEIAPLAPAIRVRATVRGSARCDRPHRARGQARFAWRAVGVGDTSGEAKLAQVAALELGICVALRARLADVSDAPAVGGDGIVGGARRDDGMHVDATEPASRDDLRAAHSRFAVGIGRAPSMARRERRCVPVGASGVRARFLCRVGPVGPVEPPRLTRPLRLHPPPMRPSSRCRRPRPRTRRWSQRRARARTEAGSPSAKNPPRATT